MPNRIRLMPELLSSKIAAGEVVDRPASVVKELIENAIDAGATDVGVYVEDGGRRVVRVTDNGSGIIREDAPLAFGRFATSKIATEDDLAGISTMGFRGEALSSIAAVSRVTMTTRARGEVAGTRVVVEGGGGPVVTDEGCACGTTVEVRDLFYNTPARRKFLRTAQTEFGRIAEAVRRIALSRPGVRFRLAHGRSSSLDAKKGGPGQRIIDIFGRDAFEGLVPVGGVDMPGRGMAVTGYVGRPELSHPTSKNVYTYVNSRWIRDRGVTRAIVDGFSGMLDGSRYPFAVIDITMPPEEVDVNVHPAKSEVRFNKPSFVFSMVKAAVGEALKKGVAEGAPGHYQAHYQEGARRYHDGRSSIDAIRGFINRGVREGAAPYESAGPAFRPDPRDAFLGGRSARAAASEPCLREEQKGAAVNPLFLEMQVIGQLWGEFLVTEAGDRFFLIDQHGAAERVAYERFRRQYRSGRISSQYLLIPERFETTPEESSEMEQAAPHLESMGFELMPFGPSAVKGGQTFLIKAVPELLSGRDSARLVKDLAEELSEAGTSSVVEERLDSVFMRIACHGVIRGARPLTPDEARALLRDMAGVDFSGHCPHGRPVVRAFTRAEVEAMFKRG